MVKVVLTLTVYGEGQTKQKEKKESTHKEADETMKVKSALRSTSIPGSHC